MAASATMVTLGVAMAVMAMMMAAMVVVSMVRVTRVVAAATTAIFRGGVGSVILWVQIHAAAKVSAFEGGRDLSIYLP